ncbi:hypothetical protein ACRQ1B_06605 [Rhizobium panacihumi]|uniref:hypothetical protein n=1 Tax=Rhizobium panacihumi TaxID=2008450 RepID=UPI003D7A3200
MYINVTDYTSFAQLAYSISAEISDAVEDYKKTAEVEPGVPAKEQAAFLASLQNLSDQLFEISGHAELIAEKIQKHKRNSLN